MIALKLLIRNIILVAALIGLIYLTGHMRTRFDVLLLGIGIAAYLVLVAWIFWLPKWIDNACTHEDDVEPPESENSHD